MLGRCSDLSQLAISESLSSYFEGGKTFTILVENVRGQEHRQVLSRKVYDVLAAKLSLENISLVVDYKKPNFVIVISPVGNEFVVGIDLCGKELNAREYRVFPHSGSLKGDLAYFLVRRSGYQPGEKLLVGLAKDGAVAIEAGLYATRRASREIQNWPYHQFPFVASAPKETHDRFQKSSPPVLIEAFDSSSSNLIAARKNSAIAGLTQEIHFQKLSLEDLDARYGEQSIDRMIFIITSKDEEMINELYYQAGLLLKPNGTLLILGREQWQLPLSDKFVLSTEEKLQRGEGYSRVWVLRKKRSN